MESFLCFIVKVLSEGRTFKERGAKSLLSRYKRFALELLSNISNNQKVIYKVFKIVEWLQLNELITPLDLAKYRIIQTIGKKAESFGA